MLAPKLDGGKEMSGCMKSHATFTYRLYTMLQKLQVTKDLEDPSVEALLRIAQKKRDWCTSEPMRYKVPHHATQDRRPVWARTNLRGARMGLMGV